jgi:hypothetical protein
MMGVMSATSPSTNREKQNIENKLICGSMRKGVNCLYVRCKMCIVTYPDIYLQYNVHGAMHTVHVILPIL